MRIAIPYENGVICPGFGRAPQFMIFDLGPDGVKEKVVVDVNCSGHDALAEFMAAQDVQAVLCAGIGHGALVALAREGIDVVPGVTGEPEAAIDALINGTLQPEGMGGCGCGGHEHGAGGCGCGGHGHEEAGGCGCGGHDHEEEHSCGCGGHGHHGGGCGCH